MKWIVVVLLCVLLTSGGCKNPFSTRSDEEPIGQPGTWITSIHPDDVIANFNNAYRQENEANLIRCLSDNFRFSAPEDSIENPPLFQGWDREVERSVTREIFNLVASESLSIFLELNPDPELPDQLVEDEGWAILFRNYELVVEGSSTAPLSNPAKGLATYHLRVEDDGFWHLRFWRDEPHVPGEGTTWTDLKLERWRP